MSLEAVPSPLVQDRPLRVLVVDDSAVVRSAVVHALAGEPDLAVVGSAPNGRIGLAKVEQFEPDVLVLDVEMPDMNGLEVLHALEQRPGRPAVVMFSSLTERGASTTIEALIAGADDYAPKPSGSGEVLAAIRAQLLPKIRQVACSRARRCAACPGGGSGRPAPPRSAASPGCSAIVIGVSTGGPNALAALVAALPESLNVPVLVVQHMPPLFLRLLAERLGKLTRLPVEEARDGAALSGGAVLVAPGDAHLTVAQAQGRPRVRLESSAPRNSCRPSADVLFESAAAAYGPRALAVVLTGMGQDGLEGARAIKRAGGCVLAQDERTSVVWGMPGSVVKAGLADAVLPLESIAPAIVSRLTREVFA